MNLAKPCLTVDVSIRGYRAAVGLLVAAAADARRMSVFEGTASTRPHLAAAMWRLAGAGSHDIACDVGCGTGTIMSEAASAAEAVSQHRVCLGGDVIERSAELASLNLLASCSDDKSQSTGTEMVEGAAVAGAGDGDGGRRGGGRGVGGGRGRGLFELCMWSMVERL